MSANFVMDNLCSRCCLIFTKPLIIGKKGLSEEQWHRQSYKDFKEAIENKCWICQKGSELLGSLPDEIDTKEDVETSLYVYLLGNGLEDTRHDIGWLRLNCHVGQQRCSATYWLSNVTDQEVDTSPEHSGLEGTTSSNDSLTRAQSWVEDCASKHANCETGYSHPPYIPTRLIHIGTDGNLWKLCDFHQRISGTPLRLRYVTLSYMWGQQRQQLMLQKSNMAQLQNGLPISTTLPKTFRDLIEVARRLSVEYLWIDALCIIQDCTQDWEAESRRMQFVYANAYCTVAGSWGNGPTKGLFHERNVDRIRCHRLQTAWQVEGKAGPLALRLFRKGGWRNIFEHSPLHSRGWALQERILSPRILYFTEYQILFECDTHKRCEVFQARINDEYLGSEWNNRVHSWHTSNTSVEAGKDIEPANTVNFFNGWTEVVKPYSRCSLTKRSDKLVAIRGLAMLYQKLSGDEYMSGLWRSHIWSLLVWLTYKPSPTANYDIAPSYSWASIDSGIEWEPENDDFSYFHPFSFVHGNSERLILRGCAPMYDPRCCSTTLRKFLKDTFGIQGLYEDLLPSCSEHYVTAAPGTSLYVLLLFVAQQKNKDSAWCGGIVVRPTGGVNTEGRLQCRRVGAFIGLADVKFAAFGLYRDEEGNFQEQGLEKIDFELI